MQITSTPAYSLPSALAAVSGPSVVASNTSSATAEGSAASTGPLFTNGILNDKALLTPEMLASIFQVNADGSVKTDAQGPVLKPFTHETHEFTAAQHMAYAEVLSEDPTLNQSADAGWNQITNSDKSLFHALTGYNLVGGSMGGTMVVDDQGNSAPATIDGPYDPNAQIAGPVTQLIGRIEHDRAYGTLTGDITPDYFAKISKDYSGAAGFPADWKDKALAWFTDAQSTQQASSGATSGVSSQMKDGLLAYQQTTSQLSSAA